MPNRNENDDREALLSDESLLEDSTPNCVESINTGIGLPAEEQPQDRLYLCHITFFLVGLSQLLPWNFLVTATNYWMYKFRHLNNSLEENFAQTTTPLPPPNEDDKSPLQTVFDSYLAIASNAPFLLVFVLTFSKHLKRLNETFKNCFAFCALLGVLISITSFVLIDTDHYQYTFLKITLVLVFLLNTMASFIQANFAGLASLLPNSIMHLMVTGQATSGIIAVISQILILFGNWSLIESTFVYFVFANLLILATILVYFISTKTKYYKYHTSQVDSIVNSRSALDFAAFRDIFKRMWPFVVSLMFTFWITISIFPAIVVLVTAQPSHKNTFFTSKYFQPVCCFLAFNLCDFLGRYLGGFFILRRDRKYTLVILALLRIIFVPLFLFCHIQPRPSYLPVVFSSELWFVLFMILFGLTNGYLVVNTFVNGPLTVPSAHRKSCGFFLMLFLGLGLTLGSLTSTLLVRIF